MEKQKGFRIFGTVTNINTGKGISGITVKAIDKDLIFDDLLGAVQTNESGFFEIHYDQEDFQELFFDKKPDIYLKIKNQYGDVIHTTEDKVRYGAGQTEEFNVLISHKLLIKEVIMKWNLKKSNELKEKIASNEDLMRSLSEVAQNVLKKYSVNLEGMSYVFEPWVFTWEKAEIPELMIKSRKAMAYARIEELEEYMDFRNLILDKSHKIYKLLPICGPMNPELLDELENLRIVDNVPDYPITLTKKTSQNFIDRIVHEKNLLNELSVELFKEFINNGVLIPKDEGVVFIPFVFETPVFAQKVGTVREFSDLSGFGPQVVGLPDPSPMIDVEIPSLPGVIKNEKLELTVGVFWHRWWWIGIPAPELLLALDKFRQFKH